jgi:microcystin-dependent protein
MFGGTYATANWLPCDGRLLSIADNTPLYALLGTTYGGDGQTTFALPDLRGRAPFHQNSTYPLGLFGGTETVTLTTQELAAHMHLPSVNSANGTSAKPTANYWASNSDFSCYAETAPNASFNPAAIGPAGGNQPHENMMPFTAVSFIIATAGVFPSSN